MNSVSVPLVSVIIPSYNHAAYIEQTIKSVWEQSYPNIELLVIDDGSTDNSVEVIKNLQQIRFFDFYAQSNHGLTQTLNTAVARTSGEFMIFFASDDIMLPDRISIQVEYMMKNSLTGICGGSMELVDSSGCLLPEKKQKLKNLPYSRADFNDVFLKNNSVPPTPTHMFRRTAFLDAGGFRPDIHLEDVYIWLKITRAGYYIDCFPALLAQYRIHDKNTHSNIRLMTECLLTIYEEYSDHPDYPKKRIEILNSQFLKASNRDKLLARELLKKLPVSVWNTKTLRGIWRLLFSEIAYNSH